METDDLPLALNPDEVMATRWIEMDELVQDVSQTPATYTPWLSIYLAKHRDMIFDRSAE